MPPQYSALPEYLCLDVRGADAGPFLHSQLSQALATLESGRAPLAGWHDARGRVRALFRLVRLPERWLLVTPRDGAEQVLKRLQMFVLRSAVTLEIASDVEVAAVLGAEPAWLLTQGLPGAAAPSTCVTLGALTWICLGANLWHVLGPPGALAALTTSLPAAPAGAAARAEIGLGLPAITAPLADRYVAQMLNLDALGALAFDKGCYPGQEVIARVHNLGDVKRRLRRYAASGSAPAVGDPIIDGQGTAVGEVVRSAATAAGAELLGVVEHTAAAAAAPLTSGGASLAALPLPFLPPSGRQH